MLGITLAVFFTMMALRENINVFYTPERLLSAEKINPSQIVRLGGMVQKGSVKRGQKDLFVRFKVTDFKKNVEVSFNGILPDLFREGQGVVVMGRLDKDGHFNATEVLAKHDENYMPPELKDLQAVSKEVSDVS
jgi:cytochrome c-type biogenesis protein CcmE